MMFVQTVNLPYFHHADEEALRDQEKLERDEREDELLADDGVEERDDDDISTNFLSLLLFSVGDLSLLSGLYEGEDSDFSVTLDLVFFLSFDSLKVCLKISLSFDSLQVCLKYEEGISSFGQYEE